MLSLDLGAPSGRSLSVLAIGAHPDDIEIGAGATLLGLAEAHPGLQAHYVVLTGSADRQLEARQAAQAFLAGAALTIELHDLPEGRLPAVWGPRQGHPGRRGASLRPRSHPCALMR